MNIIENDLAKIESFGKKYRDLIQEMQAFQNECHHDLHTHVTEMIDQLDNAMQDGLTPLENAVCELDDELNGMSDHNRKREGVL